MGVRDEGKKRLKGKHRALSFFFLSPFFFNTPAFSAWLPGCYNVKLAFLFGLWGTVWDCHMETGEERGKILERARRKRRGRERERWRTRGWAEQSRSHEDFFKKKSVKQCFHREHIGNENM